MDNSTPSSQRSSRKRRESKDGYKVPRAVKASDISALKHLDDTRLLELKEAFLLLDLDNDGVITSNDLKNTFLTLGQEVPETEIRQMMNEAMQPLDFDAFVMLLGYRTLELDPEEVLIEALSKWDRDGKGLISEDAIKHDLTTYGDRFTNHDADVALEAAPIAKGTGTGFGCSGDRMLDYPSFCKLLGGFRKSPKS